MLERQEEEFNNAMDESEEDVFGHGGSRGKGKKRKRGRQKTRLSH